MMGCLVVNQLRLGISGPGLPVKFTSVSFPEVQKKYTNGLGAMELKFNLHVRQSILHKLKIGLEEH